MGAVRHEPINAGTIWTHDLRQPPAQVDPPPGIIFRRMTHEETTLLVETLGEQTVGEFNQRLASGRLCCAAWAGDQFAGCGWASFGGEDVGELDLHLQLQPCEVYLWDFITLPAFRQRGIYAALLAWMLHTLGDEGWCRAWIGARLENVPSQRGIDRAGFLRVADLMIQQSGGKREMWLEGYPGVPQPLIAEAHRVYLGGLNGTE